MAVDRDLLSQLFERGERHLHLATASTLVITAESAGNLDRTDPRFQAARLELGLLAVIALAGGTRLIPRDADQP